MVTGGASRGNATKARGRQRTTATTMLTIWSSAVMPQNEAAAMTESVIRIEYAAPVT
jgi:hypothetical protein